jgi:hypothetical protein
LPDVRLKPFAPYRAGRKPATTGIARPKRKLLFSNLFGNARNPCIAAGAVIPEVIADAAGGSLE